MSHKAVKKKVLKYFHSHHKKGHSIRAMTDWLEQCGFERGFVEKTAREFAFRKAAKHALYIALVFGAFMLFFIPSFEGCITGAAVAPEQKDCCIDSVGECHEDYIGDFCSRPGFMEFPEDSTDIPYCSGEKSVYLGD